MLGFAALTTNLRKAWIPAFAGMTGVGAGMTGVGAGMMGIRCGNDEIKPQK